VTAPAKNALEEGLEQGVRGRNVKPGDGTRTVTVTSDIAVERVVNLLNEVVAQGALPAL
jgi:hypothetical protein